MKQFEELKKELESEAVENNNRIKLCDGRMRIANANSFEYKATNILGFSLLGYLIVFLLSSIIFKNLSIPVLAYQTMVITSSIGLGTLFTNSLFKKYKIKERLKMFSESKTDIEKLQEEVNYQIESEKACNRNKVIKETLDTINSTESMVNELSNKYDITEKYSSRSKEELENSIEEISNLIKEKYNELDILSSKKVLHDRFWKIRSKFDKNANLIAYSLIVGVFASGIVGIPFITFNSIAATSTILARTLSVFWPLVIGSMGTFVYFIKRNKDYEKVFNNYNSQLEDEALPDTFGKNYDASDENSEIKALIEKQVRDTSTAIIKLNDEKVSLEVKENEQNVDELHDSTEEMTYYSKHVESLKSIDYSAVLGIDKSVTEQTDSSHAQTKGPVLSRKLDIGKKNN